MPSQENLQIWPTEIEHDLVAILSENDITDTIIPPQFVYVAKGHSE